MIDENITLNKIKKFVTEEYNQLPKKGALIVKSVGNGYQINDTQVTLKDNVWQVINNNKTIVANLYQRRVAILLAALVSKRYYKNIPTVTCIDKQLDIYLNDKQLYSIRTKTNPNNEVYKDRLSRVERELELLDQQLHELEKSVSLQ
jgi:hypothetical protein